MCFEIYETDRNYLTVLETIMKVFYEPLVQNRQNNHLNAAEIKIIFGNLEPIVKVHRLIVASLASLMENWDEKALVGKIFIDNVRGVFSCVRFT